MRRRSIHENFMCFVSRLQRAESGPLRAGGRRLAVGGGDAAETVSRDSQLCGASPVNVPNTSPAIARDCSLWFDCSPSTVPRLSGRASS